MYAFALGHAVLGVWGFAAAMSARFEAYWAMMAIVGPLLLANAIGVTLRREAVDRKTSRAIALTCRTLGGFALMVGALAMRVDLDMAWTVMGAAGAIGLWGVAHGWAIARSDDAFARA